MTENHEIIPVRLVVAAPAQGRLLVTDEPISFWGGVDPASGVVTDGHHPLQGQSMAGRILAFPFTKGSSGAGQVILELVRSGHAPAAIINITTEPVLATGPLAARFLYGRFPPLAEVAEADFARLKDGRFARLEPDQNRLVVES